MEKRYQVFVSSTYGRRGQGKEPVAPVRRPERARLDVGLVQGATKRWTRAQNVRKSGCW
jgi:hypothetical protein